ncbi:FAD binding domain-containing protein [Mesorhizobium sp. ES1-4]|uniref:FAD binding domain-containing protein n=1 Tax=Mesorhizobium sp. ES1-4 TaxID=2876627 RepID=UPI001CC9DF16|nr:FAD binding domain-containing protein [Mesorhizobium sp. ES1-4]MBZ9798683.1 FAD binding domain-containing protein [Mesorhizobium sp. ES1-4]
MMPLAIAVPADVAELRAAIVSSMNPVRFLAGGTDMLIAGRALPEAGLLIDITRVADMAFISTDGSDICIGAATTVATVASHPGLRARLPALCNAAAQCGSVQIRNRATIGGNIANAAPAADLMPVLTVAGALLRLIGRDGMQSEILLGDYTPAHGLITDVILPGAGLLRRSAFVKLGPREDLAISRLNLALLADFQNGCFGAVRIAAGALSHAPLILSFAEAALSGRKLEAAVLRDFLSTLAAEVDAAIPGRNSQLYKRRAIAGLGLDLIAQALGLSPRDRLFEEAVE